MSRQEELEVLIPKVMSNLSEFSFITNGIHYFSEENVKYYKMQLKKLSDSVSSLNAYINEYENISKQP